MFEVEIFGASWLAENSVLLTRLGIIALSTTIAGFFILIETHRRFLGWISLALSVSVATLFVIAGSVGGGQSEDYLRGVEVSMGEQGVVFMEGICSELLRECVMEGRAAQSMSWVEGDKLEVTAGKLTCVKSEVNPEAYKYTLYPYSFLGSKDVNAVGKAKDLLRTVSSSNRGRITS